MQAFSSAFLSVALAVASSGAQPALPQHIWLEAETFGPLKGSNFSITPPDKQQAGSWAISGPGVADAWTQGGESEWMSIAARADETTEVIAGHDVEVPVAGTYTLWVRYSDYREKEEAFGVRVKQGARKWEHIFGRATVIDEMDPMKLLWDWSFAWDHSELPLEEGAARVEFFTTGPTQARRQIDCLCLTTDATYHPHGREKPEFAAWKTLAAMRDSAMPPVEPLTAKPIAELPAAWRIADRPPAFVWNVRQQWTDELKKPVGERIDSPFAVDDSLLKPFLAAHRDHPPAIYSEPLSGPVWHIPEYPKAFATGSPFLEWLTTHPDRPFAVLLNYGDPSWPKDADRKAVHANLAGFADRFQGYIAGESISHTSYDNAALEAKVRTAKSRADVLEALREIHTASVVKKFSDYYGAPVTAEAAWAPVISCLSANMEAFAHALCHWGVQRIGHENTANSPTLARRLAFLRGAARQFGRKIADYQSCNFGDAATMYSRELFMYPATSRYVLDNSYDAFAGAGMNWLWKDYLLWHFAGVSTFYNEQGVDLFWKPGGGSAGDEWPVQLSPKGKVAQAALGLAQDHPRGTQWTPIAFLLDEAHGWAQERFSPGAFGLDPALNPAVLTPGRHEASLRGWFDLAYFPAPQTQSEPIIATRQCYVNGIFGDIFDVIVNAPGRTSILSSYPVVIVAGEVPISVEWGKALAGYVEGGGTLVVCVGQLSGEGVAALTLPALGEAARATAFTWQPSRDNVQAQAFRYQPLNATSDRVLATAGDGQPMAVLATRGKGRLISVGIPLGLGIDDRPVPVLALLLRHLAQDLTPIRAVGDVEWTLNRLDDGHWLLALLNNSGVEKPQHGIVPTRHQESRSVKLEAAFPIRTSEEWLTHHELKWQSADKNASVEVDVPAGAVRLIEVTPAR